jgi:hypothetical protein
MPVGHQMHGGVAGIKHMVAEHDVTTIGEDVELHGGGSEKLVLRSINLAHLTALLNIRPCLHFPGLFTIRVE